MTRAAQHPCAVCARPALGFGWFDPVKQKQRRPSVMFCSMVCQGFWSRLARRSPAMVDLSEQEQAAMRAAMRNLGEAMQEIGWNTRLCDLNEAQVLTLIEVAVGAFQDAMRASARQAIGEIPF
jgi:hypothetical protein